MSETSPLHTALRLGRVSNVPTVWTNVAAGLALTGAPLHPPLIILLGLAVSLFYVGGMYLNDAFDAGWDRQHRPERPIPSGLVRARTVYLAGFAMLAAGLVIVACGTTTLAPAVRGGAALPADRALRPVPQGQPLEPAHHGPVPRVRVRPGGALRVSAPPAERGSTSARPPSSCTWSSSAPSPGRRPCTRAYPG